MERLNRCVNGTNDQDASNSGGRIGPHPSQFGCLQVGNCVMLFSRMVERWLDSLSTRLAPSNLPLVAASDVAKWVSTQHDFAGTPHDVGCVAKPMRPLRALTTRPSKGNGKSNGNQLRRPKQTNRCKTATLMVGLLHNHEAQSSVWYDAPVRKPFGPPFVYYAIEFSSE